MSLPHQVGVIPRRANSFQHRHAVDQVHSVLADAGTVVSGQVLAGMGGVGKTQLAADYARTAWQDGGIDVLVWITASARSPVVTGYAQAGVELCGADPGDPEQAAQTFLGWLEPKTGGEPCRWLVVLDDVADPDDLRGLWPPASTHGRTLVTTRRRDAALTGADRRPIEVSLFTKDEAAAYLTTSLAAYGRTEPADQLTALAADLGRLPLALAQAAAFLIDSGLDTATYRDLLADRTTTLADTTPDRLPDDQALPLAAAWALSIDRADTLRPVGLARPMLQLAAMLDANGIPHDVLTSAPALTHLAAHRTRTGPDATAAPAPPAAGDALRALRALHRLSLIDHTPDTPNQAVRIHQLIQRTTRDTLTPNRYDQTARTAADALTAAWPAIERDTALAQILRANTTALTANTEDTLYQPDAHAVLYRIGRSLGESGQTTAAITHFQHLVANVQHRLGPAHPHALAARHDLAHWRRETGDWSGAAIALAELLDDRVRVLGLDHPDTLATRHDLAASRSWAGDEFDTVAAFAELLDDRVRALGPDHPDTLATRHDLAYWRGMHGDASEAVAAFAELLDDRVRVLGLDHPDTLATRHDLAFWRGVDGDASEAVAAFAELLDDRVRVLGPDHPDTLATRGFHATWKVQTGDEAGAAVALAELLDSQMRVLGPGHPQSRATCIALAAVRMGAGNEAGAVVALAELLDSQTRVLGPDHPATRDTRALLARFQSEAGQRS
ncbi:FxSxx-COOH system tetratricopeptide repeat protein [Streptomyces sp. NPDC059909]|uniref:FxSxx-COOH system tetratricopeptide repeat protein n=1 Tax=Streptomyces sp. NPDC059909 TaxID=3346998 RepID=UPI00366838CF